jgi:hypothetical protein
LALFKEEMVRKKILEYNEDNVKTGKVRWAVDILQAKEASTMKVEIFEGEKEQVKKEMNEWLQKNEFKKIWFVSSCGMSVYCHIAITVIYE